MTRTDGLMLGWMRAGWIVLASVVMPPSLAAQDHPDVVSIACTSWSHKVRLDIHIDTARRQVSIKNRRTRRWDAIASVWVAIYDDQFQLNEPSTGKHYMLIDRRSGAFRYSTASLDKARHAPPIGRCSRTGYEAPPELPRPIKPPNKF